MRSFEVLGAQPGPTIPAEAPWSMPGPQSNKKGPFGDYGPFGQMQPSRKILATSMRLMAAVLGYFDHTLLSLCVRPQYKVISLGILRYELKLVVNNSRQYTQINPGHYLPHGQN